MLIVENAANEINISSHAEISFEIEVSQTYGVLAAKNLKNHRISSQFSVLNNFDFFLQKYTFTCFRQPKTITTKPSRKKVYR
jgi:hypothetical protein